MESFKNSCHELKTSLLNLTYKLKHSMFYFRKSFDFNVQLVEPYLDVFSFYFLLRYTCILFHLGAIFCLDFRQRKWVSGQFCVPRRNLKVVWVTITGRMWGYFTLLAKYTKAVLGKIDSFLWKCSLWRFSNKCIMKCKLLLWLV